MIGKAARAQGPRIPAPPSRLYPRPSQVPERTADTTQDGVALRRREPQELLDSASG